MVCETSWSASLSDFLHSTNTVRTKDTSVRSCKTVVPSFVAGFECVRHMYSGITSAAKIGIAGVINVRSTGKYVHVDSYLPFVDVFGVVHVVSM